MTKKMIILTMIMLVIISGCARSETITKKDQEMAIGVANEFMLCLIQNKLDTIWDKYMLEEAKKGSTFKSMVDEYNVTRNNYGGIKKATLDYTRVLNLPNKGVQVVYKLELGNHESADFDLVMEVDESGRYKAFNMNGQTKIYGNIPKIYNNKYTVITPEGIVEK